MNKMERGLMKALNDIRDYGVEYKIERSGNIIWLADALSALISLLDISEGDGFFVDSSKSYTLKELRRLKKSIDRLIEKIKIIGDE